MDKNSQKVVVLTGGGTAGHIWPTIEVGKALKKFNPELHLIYLGIKAGQEEKIAKNEGFEFYAISSGKWNRFLSFRNLITPFRILKGYFEAKKILKSKNVKVVFAKGGFVSFPVILAASRQKIPIIGHESDSIMGRTNLWLSRFMTNIAVAFPRVFYSKKLHKKLFYSGIPVRESFYLVKKEQAKIKLGLEKDLPVLVVTGGSQGALTLNQIIWDFLGIFLKHCQIIHLTGEKSIKRAEEIKKRLNDRQKARYRISAYSLEMPDILSAADLVISRAGANTLFEIAYLKKPAILIPYPYAAQNHQEKNARFAVSLGGAKIFLESKFNKKQFLDTVLYLLENRDERQIMGEKIASLYKKNSAEIIAQKILEII